MSDQVTAPLLDTEELIAIVTELLDALMMNANTDIDPSIGMTGGSGNHNAFTGTVTINNGDSPGRLTIDTDQSTCETLARCWGLVGPEGPTHDDALDALAEFVNVVGGTVKSAFEEETFVGIPEVSEGIGELPAMDPAEVFHALGQFHVRFALA
jgi:hypothetical protein